MKLFKREINLEYQGIYKTDLFISEESYEDERSITTPKPNPAKIITHNLNNYFYEHMRKIREARDQTNNNRITMLSAYGTDNKQWEFQDSGRYYSVQEWVAAKDKEGYLAIFLSCCNPGSYKLMTKESILIYPDNYLCLENLLISSKPKTRILINQEK